MYQHLDMVYHTAARYCVIFISESYAKKAWTKHELKSAQARAFKENSEYILPVRLDNTELPGLPPSIGYLDARKLSLSEMCALIVTKLGLRDEKDVAEQLNSENYNERVSALTQIAIHRLTEHFERIIQLMLNDSSDAVREKAAWALDNINDTRVLPSLIQAIHDHSRGVRSNAGWALVHLGEIVRPDVERILETSNNESVKDMATLILQRLM